MMTFSALLHDLQLALAWEYAPAIQYTRHAGLFDERGIRDPFTKKVAKELHKHALEEMHHAQLLSKWIPLIGVAAEGHPAVPTLFVEHVATDILTEGRLDYGKMLVADLQGEIDAIDRYNRLIDTVSTFDWPDMRKRLIFDLKIIRKVEEEHACDLKKWLTEMSS